MEEKYKDWAIKYSEESETFIATDAMENTLKSQKLKELKKKIDKFGFKRVPILCTEYYSGDLILVGEITSIKEKSDGSPDALVSYTNLEGNKERMSTSIMTLYKQTDSNMKLAKEINDLVKEKNKLKKQIEKLQKQLEKIATEDLDIVSED